MSRRRRVKVVDLTSLAPLPIAPGRHHVNPPFAEAIRSSRTPRANLARYTGFPESILEAIASDPAVTVEMSWGMYLAIRLLASTVEFDGELFHEPDCICGKGAA